MLVACGCSCPLVGGTFCAVSQKCTRTILGSDMGPGCFFLVLRGERSAGECVFLVYPLTQKLRSSRMWRLRRGPSSYVSLRTHLEEFPFLRLLLALFALGNLVHCLLMAFVPCTPVSGVRVCLRSAESWILREMPWCFWAQCLARLWLLVLSECCLRNTVIGSIGRLSGYCRNAWLDSGYIFCVSAWLLNVISHISASKWTRILKYSLSILSQTGEVCSAASVFWSSSRCSHLENWTLLLRASRG